MARHWLGNMPLKRIYRAALALFIGLILGGSAALSYAGTVAYKFNGLNVVREGGVTRLVGESPNAVAAAGTSVSQGVINASGSANWYAGVGALQQAGGVVFNAAVPIAVTAASVAVTAVRANPAGLITSAVASYLLSKGISYAEGSFSTSVPGQTTPAAGTYVGTCTGSYPYSKVPGQYCTQGGAYFGCWAAKPATNANAVDLCAQGQTYYHIPSGTYSPCPAGSTYTAGTCQAPASTRATTDADWDAARVGYWPDAAILDLVRNGVPLPTDKAVFSPESKDVPMSDPYIDPKDGKRYKDVARVTPQPSAPDSAVVQVVKQEVDASGNPVTNNGTPVAPTEQTDLCKQNPDILACQKLDVPTAPDITNQDKNITITPDSGWGADNGTCPADRVTQLHMGVTHVQSWQPVCYAVTTFRPALLAIAWVSAVLIAVGIYRSHA